MISIRYLSVMVLGCALLGAPSRAARDGDETAEPDGLQAANAMIPQATTARTIRSIYPVYEKWAQKNLHDFYDASEDHNPKWDADAHLLISSVVAKQIDLQTGLNRFERWDLAQKLKTEGCTNPLITFLGLEQQPDREARKEQLTVTANRMAELDYSPLLQFLCNAELFSLSSKVGEPMTPLGEKCMTFFRAAVGETPLSDDAAMLLNTLLLRAGPTALATTEKGEYCELLELLPAIPKWIARQMKGERHIRLAWKARGGGYAGTVKGGAWEVFGEELKQAQGMLENAYQLNPADPETSAKMVAVSMGLSSSKEMRLWFDRSVTAQFDYPHAYDAMRWGLRGRWLGSREALMAFGKQCAATKRYETSVPLQLAWCCGDQGEDDRTKEFYTKYAPWPELNAMFQGYILEPNGPVNESYIRGQAAYFAYRCGHLTEAMTQLEALHFELDGRTAFERKVDAKQWPQDVRAEAVAAGHR